MNRIFIAFLITFGTLLSTCSCNMSAPVYNEMLEYYSDETHYEVLTGEIARIENNDLISLEITSHSPHFTSQVIGTIRFRIYNIDESIKSTIVQNLSIGDIITITSAPRYFYSSHDFPILSIQKNNLSLLDFDEGKSSLLEWIEVTFG